VFILRIRRILPTDSVGSNSNSRGKETRERSTEVCDRLKRGGGSKRKFSLTSHIRKFHVKS